MVLYVLYRGKDRKDRKGGDVIDEARNLAKGGWRGESFLNSKTETKK